MLNPRQMVPARTPQAKFNPARSLRYANTVGDCRRTINVAQGMAKSMIDGTMLQSGSEGHTPVTAMTFITMMRANPGAIAFKGR